MATNGRDFDDLLERANFGKDPSDAYVESVEALDNVVRECMHVSHGYGGIASPTPQHFYASVLFTVLVTKGVSLLSLAPHSSWAAKQIEHWDYATAAVIARTMLEARLAFHYLCADPCSADEWECRWNLFNLHDCTARKRLFATLEQLEQVAGFETQANELRERLNANPFFKSLPDGQQRKLLNGQTAYLFSLEDIAERAGIQKTTFRYLYILLSSHVHSLPMSFYRMGDGHERGRGVPSPVEEGYTSMCLSLACSLLVHTRDELHRLFDGLAKDEQPQPTSRELEEKLALAEAQPEALTVGESVEMFRSEEVKIVVKRLEGDNIEISYYHVPSDALVLSRYSGENGSGLTDIDPFFWTVEVDGAPATDLIIEQTGKSPYAFKVDHLKRKLSLKTQR